MTAPDERAYFDRPMAELLGRHVDYSFAGNGVHTAIGNYTQTVVDLSFPDELQGLLNWGRVYNSRSDVAGPLGRGWTTTFSAHLTITREGVIVHHDGPVRFHDEDGRVLTFTPDEPGRFHRPQDLDADLTQDADGNYTLTFNSGERWHFDSAGRLTSRTREGQQVVLEYDGEGRLLRLRHSLGWHLSLFYNNDGLLIRVLSGDGRAVAYTHDAGGSLESAAGPGDGVTRYESTEDGLLRRVINADGAAVVTNTYDATGRVVHQDFATGGGADFAYDTSTRATTVTSTPSDARTVFRADSHGRTIEIIDPAANRSTFTYDERGRLSTATTPGGARLTQAYDAQDNLLSSSLGGSTTRWTYDEANRVISETGPDGGVTRYAYTGSSHIPTEIIEPGGGRIHQTVSRGLITSSTDATGGVTRYEYAQDGTLVSIIDPLGKVTRFGYDTAGNRNEIRTPDGGRRHWVYDAEGRVTQHTDPSGAVFGFRYSAGGLLQEQTDPGGATTRFGYDAAGNQISITDPLGRSTSFTYDADGNMTSVTDPNDAVTRYTHDALGRISSVTDPVGAVTRYSHDADGNVVAEEDASGTTHTSYDAHGRPVWVSTPTGATTHYAYDAAGRMNRVTDPEGASWHVEHDAAGMPVTVTDPTGAKVKQEWNPDGQLASVSDPLGRTYSIGRDKLGRVTEVVDGEGGITRYAYDPAGRRISVTTPAGLISRTQYDNAGRVIATIDPRGWVTRYEYDARGRKTSQTSPGGVTIGFRYDDAGQLTATINGEGNETHYGYDNAGHLISVTDAKGAATHFAYDQAGRVISSTDPLGRTTRREYDGAGNLVAIIDPSGHAERMTYDGDKRLTRHRADDGTEVSYTYDKVGRRASMTDATGTTRYAYDGAGNLISSTGPDGAVVKSEYDKAGQRTKLTYPDGHEVCYRYDLNRHLVGLRDSRAGDVAYALDPDGRLLTEQLPGRFARRYHYEQGLLNRFEVVQEGHPVSRTTFTHDPDGRILTQRDDSRFFAYRYDRLGQIVSARQWEMRNWPWEPTATPPDWAHLAREQHGFWLERDALHFTYDAAGNRTVLREGDSETHYRYDEADQLVSSAAHGLHTSYHYDTSGRLIETVTDDGRCEVKYNGLGRPITVIRTGDWPAHRIDSTFNGDGLPTLVVLSNEDVHSDSKRAASVRYRWSHDDVPQVLTQRADLALEDTEQGQPNKFNADFTYGYGRVFANWQQGSEAFHRDAFGSAIRTDATSTWAQAGQYGLFGAPESGHGASPELPRFGYRGELALGSILDLRARFYDATLGRFTTRDPITPEEIGPGNADHPYVYAGNDPLNATDPLGLLAASAVSQRRAEARSATQSTVAMAAAGQGGDRTTLHNIARAAAMGQLAIQMLVKYGHISGMRAEYPIPRASKRYINRATPPPDAKEGFADLLYEHKNTAWIWEVKSGLSDEPREMRKAQREVKHYAQRYMTAYPGSKASAGDPMSVPMPLSGRFSGYFVHSPLKNRGGAITYRKGPTPPPRPQPQPQPQPQPHPVPVPTPRPVPPVPSHHDSPGINWGAVGTAVGAVALAAGAITLAIVQPEIGIPVLAGAAAAGASQ